MKFVLLLKSGAFFPYRFFERLFMPFLLFFTFIFCFVLDVSPSDRCLRKKASPYAIKALSADTPLVTRDLSSGGILAVQASLGNAVFFEDLCVDDSRFWAFFKKGLSSSVSILMYCDDAGENPLHIAIRNKNSSVALKLIELMLKHKDEHDKRILRLIEQIKSGRRYHEQKKKNTERYMVSLPRARDDFHTACQDLKIIAQQESDLKAQFIAFDSLNSNNQTPLDCAIELGLHDVSKKLIEVTIGDKLAELFLRAMFDRDSNRAIMLIRYKGHVGAKTLWLANNALHLAIELGLEDVINVLLESSEAESLVQESNIDGNTPIYTAISRGNINIALRLAKYEGVLKHRNNQPLFSSYRNQGLTPAEFARDKGFYALVSEFESLS